MDQDQSDAGSSSNDVEPISKSGGSTPKPKHPNHKYLKRLGAVLFLAIVASLVLLYFMDKNANDVDESTQAAIEELEDEIEADVDSYWSDDLIEQLRAYDQSNDNVDYVVNSDTITIASNGLPGHDTGEFPNSGNPNSISEQDHEFTVTRRPVKTNELTEMRIFGVSLGGIPFEPGTAERDQTTGWSIEAFNTSAIFDPGVDFNNAHVQPNGTYHYHGIPESISEDADMKHSNLIGFAADGFPIYSRHGYSDPKDSSSDIVQFKSSWQVKTGQRASNEPIGSYNGDYTQDYEYAEGSGNLDQCNGIYTITPEFPGGIYAYFLTEQFPYVPRCVFGSPDSSFLSNAESPSGLESGGTSMPAGQGGQPPQGPAGSPPGPPPR